MGLFTKPVDVYVVVSMQHVDNGIGVGNIKPWDMPEEKHFLHYMTCSNSVDTRPNVVMVGKCTWMSYAHNPLDTLLRNRIAIVFSHSEVYGCYSLLDQRMLRPGTAYSFNGTFKDCIRILKTKRSCFNDVYVIGGCSLYREALLADKYFKGMYIITVYPMIAYPCDRFLEGGWYAHLKHTHTSHHVRSTSRPYDEYTVDIYLPRDASSKWKSYLRILSPRVLSLV